MSPREMVLGLWFAAEQPKIRELVLYVEVLHMSALASIQDVQ